MFLVFLDFIFSFPFPEIFALAREAVRIREADAGVQGLCLCPPEA
jgi:hypothetical protein